jgi:hypothetical protein
MLVHNCNEADFASGNKIIHGGNMAKFNNADEYNQWKAKKIEDAREKMHKKKIAKEVAAHLTSDALEEMFEEEAPPASFFQQLTGIFTYPITGNGKFLLIGGAIMFVIADFMSIVPFVGLIVGLIVFGYMCAYMMKIVASSAQGKCEVPDWPDFSDYWDDIISPAFEVGGTALICFAPFFMYVFAASHSPWREDPLSWGLFAAGAFCYPMVLLAVSQFHSLQALNPLVIVPSIFRVPADYLVVCIVLSLIIFLSSIVQKAAIPIPVIGSVVDEFIALYFVVIEMRILGILYNANQNRLNWFGETGE